MKNAPRAPYALEPTEFPMPALAALAGRAQMGGQREIALACFIASRLVPTAGSCDELTPEQRAVRAQRAKQWLGAAALPPSLRASLTRLADSTATDDRAAMLGALETVMTVTANSLDSRARLELGRVAQAIEK